jgi:hypothetical protein
MPHTIRFNILVTDGHAQFLLKNVDHLKIPGIDAIQIIPRVTDGMVGSATRH